MQIDFDIVIVGAGGVGLAIAAAMKSSNYRILILESKEVPTFDPTHYDLRVNTLNLASETFLNAIGAWSKMKEMRVSSFNCIKVWDSAGGRIQFQADEIGETHLGHVVESSVLTSSLLKTIESPGGITLMPNVQLKSIRQGETASHLFLTNDEQISCRLVIGADGGNSTVRQTAGIKCTESKYDQIALVAQIESSEPRDQTALQAFLPTGPLAFLPLADGSFSIVWSVEKSYGERLLSLSEKEFEQCLAESIDYQLGNTRLLSRMVSFHLRKLEAASYLSGRTVLAGDAAHIIHPLAGMGVNLGLMDAAVLKEVLTTDLADPTCDSMLYANLRKYERWRKSTNVPTALVMDGFDWGFRHPSPLVQGMLGMGLTLTNRLNIAKHEIMRLACGLAGDLPEIARRR